MAESVGVLAVNRFSRIALLDDGTACQITNLFDIDGDEPEDPDQAVVAVAKVRDDLWVTIDLDGYSRVETH